MAPGCIGQPTWAPRYFCRLIREANYRNLVRPPLGLSDSLATQLISNRSMLVAHIFCTKEMVSQIILCKGPTCRRLLSYHDRSLSVKRAQNTLKYLGYTVLIQGQPPERSDTNSPLALVASVRNSRPAESGDNNRCHSEFGHVEFKAGGKDGSTVVRYRLCNLEPGGYHAMHVHQWGDLRNGCTSAGPHWNPDGAVHGGPHSSRSLRHVGDLGNVQADENGVAEGELEVKDMPLSGQRGVLGRMLVIHGRADDLGCGCEHDSLTTGHAGNRIGCGVIGYAQPQ